jgi:hypothetical protein
MRALLNPFAGQVNSLAAAAERPAVSASRLECIAALTHQKGGLR